MKSFFVESFSDEIGAMDSLFFELIFRYFEDIYYLTINFIAGFNGRSQAANHKEERFT